MVKIITPQYEISEGPESIDRDNVQYWSRHTMELEKTQRSKALKFLRHDCIQYIAELKQFVCLPLNTKDKWQFGLWEFTKRPYPKDYNSSEYLMWQEQDIETMQKRWHCSCQGWEAANRHPDKFKADGVQCCHTLSLMYAFKAGEFHAH